MKVLLTGASGFIGRHCLERLLRHGHHVVATVRSEQKAAQIVADYPTSSDALSFHVVKDIASPGAFDECLRAFPLLDAVLHTASPFHYAAVDPRRDMIDPAVHGTLEILRSVRLHAQNVKRVVVTSSFASIVNFETPQNVYTASDWNPITMEQALAGGLSTYVGSKKFAEKAAWDFMESETPNFTLSTINPVLVFGPVLHLENLEAINTSNEPFRDIIQGKMKDEIPPGGFHWVDVRDVALAHVKAIEVEEAAGRRFIAAAGPYNNHQLASIAKNTFPELVGKLPERIDIPKSSASFEIDTQLTREILGVRFTPLEDSVIDTVRSLLKVDV